MKKAIVFMNEQHKLLEEQKEQLDKTFESVGWELRLIPSKGWAKEEMKEQIIETYDNDIVFVSPVPYMLLLMNEYRSVFGVLEKRVYLFHNDKREKKELPNGKVIYTVASTGWELV